MIARIVGDTFRTSDRTVASSSTSTRRQGDTKSAARDRRFDLIPAELGILDSDGLERFEELGRNRLLSERSLGFEVSMPVAGDGLGSSDTGL
jgi:hypothetical protein